ncbi:MAG: prolyl oligopeptidase family serine peptidase [Bacteroidaceae bacterium]|nr:prolyl oligopeptidase family serine peptidase [Bacteroidaceae bacterium]
MKKFTILLTTVILMSCNNKQIKLIYPKTATVDTVDTYFGTQVPDPFRWLENDTSTATAAWVQAENKVTNEYLSHIPFRNKLKQELTEIANYERLGTPFKKNGKFYFFKNNGLQNQSVLYEADSLHATPHVFLDPNKLSDDGTVALKGIYFAKNGKYMAYTISRSGSDWEEIYVKDLSTDQLTPDHIVWAKFTDVAWSGNGFYYSAYNRPAAGHKAFSNINVGHKVYYHNMGTPQSKDLLIFQNQAEPKRFYTAVTNNEETYLYLFESGAGSGNNLFMKDLTKKDSPFIQLTTDFNYQYSPIGIHDGKLYLLTNYQAQKFCIMETDLNHLELANWKKFIPQSDMVLTDAQLISDKLLLTYSKDASDRAYFFDFGGEMKEEIKLPSLGSISISGEKDDKDCFMSFTSFTTPGTIYQLNTNNGELNLYMTPKVKFDANAFVTEQVFFASKDGTKIPMFLTYRKDLKKDGKNPAFIYGYGGFDIGLSPYFSAYRIPFLENGGIYAQVNLRGGNEYGEAWHLAGTKMHKQNVFDDFIAATEYLIAQNYTNKNLTAIVGGSNGGLLVGACMTQRPDLFRVAVPQVGVMDMLRYHKFTIGWNWASDYGTSEDSKEMFEYLKSYSPLHNLKPGTKYPATLITTADHDDRVVPAHSFKFAATLQTDNAGTNPTIIRIDSKAGHGGGKPMTKIIEEQTDIYGFIMYNLGMNPKL